MQTETSAPVFVKINHYEFLFELNPTQANPSLFYISKASHAQYGTLLTPYNLLRVDDQDIFQEVAPHLPKYQ